MNLFVLHSVTGLTFFCPTQHNTALLSKFIDQKLFFPSFPDFLTLFLYGTILSDNCYIAEFLPICLYACVSFTYCVSKK